jgi:thioredoxin reductase (NADPH)
MLTGQRAFLSAVATSAGRRVLAVPVAQVRLVMAREPGLSDLILRTFLLRHSILMSRGTRLTLIGSPTASVAMLANCGGSCHTAVPDRAFA